MCAPCPGEKEGRSRSVKQCEAERRRAVHEGREAKRCVRACVRACGGRGRGALFISCGPVAPAQPEDIAICIVRAQEDCTPGRVSSGLLACSRVARSQNPIPPTSAAHIPAHDPRAAKCVPSAPGRGHPVHHPAVAGRGEARPAGCRARATDFPCLTTHSWGVSLHRVWAMRQQGMCTVDQRLLILD